MKNIRRLKLSEIISNPPYNLKFEDGKNDWDISEKLLNTNANFAFVEIGLQLATDKACFLLPKGVFSTNAKVELEIKKGLVDDGNILSCISLPERMFESTSIPVCILIVQKKPTENILMIDLTSACQKEIREQNGQFGGNAHTKRTYKKTINILSDETIQGVAEAIKEFKPYKNLSKIVSTEEIKKQGYTLNPVRYLDFANIEEERRDIKDIVKDINLYRRHKNKLKLVINETLAKKLGFKDLIEHYKNQKEIDEDLVKNVKKITGIDLLKDDYFQLTKNKNQFEFKNNDPELFSEILQSIYQAWKANLMFLNNVENMYLVELRDTLLPKLMSGELNIEQIEVEE